MIERLKWANQYLNMTQDFWNRVVFSNECRVQYNTRKQKFWVYQDYEVEPTERDRWQTSILIWGAITYNGISIIEVINGNMNGTTYLSILKKRLLKKLPTLGPH